MTERTETTTTGAEPSTTSNENSTTDGKTTEVRDRILVLGEAANIDDRLEGTVEAYRFTSEYEKNGAKKSTDRTFLFVQFNVENSTNTRQDIPAKMSIYVKANGKRYDPTDYKGAVRSLYTTGSLDAGVTKTGVLIFEVPRNTTRSDVVTFFEYTDGNGMITDRWSVK